mgnify:CR=1 FL=1
MKTRIKLMFIAVIAIFASCGKSPADFSKGAVISDIKSTEDGCIYYTYNHVFDGNHLLSKGYFFDSCGKFTVGDTVKIVKQ